MARRDVSAWLDAVAGDVLTRNAGDQFRRRDEPSPPNPLSHCGEERGNDPGASENTTVFTRTP